MDKYLENSPNWGSVISRLALLMKESLSFARLSKSLQDSLWKNTRLSQSNSEVILREDTEERNW